MIEQVLENKELVKLAMGTGAGVAVAVFTIYLLIKLIEKVIMSQRFTRRADDYLDQINESIKKLSDEKEGK
jgi:hypothetical protein